MLFTNITGKKETKGYNEPIVICCPTPGEFRITPLAQKMLDLKDGDFGLLLVHPDDNTRVYLAKGIAGVPTRDGDGNLVKDGRGRHVYEEGTGFGAVVRTASEGSMNLKLTGAAGWNAAGGDVNKNQLFTLGEGEEGGVLTGETDPTGEKVVHTTMFYELIFKSSKDKSVRVKSEGEAGAQAEDSQEEEEEFEDPEFEQEEV